MEMSPRIDLKFNESFEINAYTYKARQISDGDGQVMGICHSLNNEHENVFFYATTYPERLRQPPYDEM